MSPCRTISSAGKRIPSKARHLAEADFAGIGVFQQGRVETGERARGRTEIPARLDAAQRGDEHVDRFVAAVQRFGAEVDEGGEALFPLGQQVVAAG